MRPQKLSKKLNPLGENMNLPDAFNQLKNTKHDSSFENLGEWLNQNTSKPKKMKSFYKVAASLIFATMILIACTVPVQHEEEIGYMIKGLALDTESKSKQIFESKFKEAGLNPSQVSISQIIFEKEETNDDKFTEVVMVLPKADYKAAEDKKAALSRIFSFQSLEILPIEETVERTIFESTLHTFDLKVKEEITEEEISVSINKFLHENSNNKGNASLKTDKEGNRYVEIEVVFEENSSLDSKASQKRSIERLHKDLAPKNEYILEEMTEEEIKALKLKEIKKQEMEQKDQ